MTSLNSRGRLQLGDLANAFNALMREREPAAKVEVVFEPSNVGMSFERRLNRAVFLVEKYETNRALIVTNPWEGTRHENAETVAERVYNHMRTLMPGEAADEHPYPLDPAYFHALNPTPRAIIESPVPLGGDPDHAHR